MARAEAIRIDGLAEFSRSLKKLSSDLPKALRIALNEAADVVVSDVVPRVPRKTGRAQASIKARSTRTEARVSAGGARASYYPFLDFGGSVGRKKSVKRAFFSEGRYLFPSYRKLRDSGEFERVLTKALLDVARQAGVGVD